MAYYFSKTVKGSFEEVKERATAALKAEGFGVLTQIDVRQTLKAKLGEEFRNYVILGACNPPFALKALQAEDKIGTMLPCNVVLQEPEPGSVEVAAVDPIASMQAVKNNELMSIATEVRQKLKRVIDSLE